MKLIRDQFLATSLWAVEMVDLGRAADWGRASCLSDSSGNMEIEFRV